jgi:antitoxin MazE
MKRLKQSLPFFLKYRIIFRNYVYTMYIQKITERVRMEQKDMNEEKEVEIMTVATTVQKWGNSLAIRIPKDVAERVEIYQGSEMEIKVVGNEGIITLVPKKQQKKYSLDELLAQCKPAYRHDEIDFGIEGNELI